jgi:acetyltransferase-like isoleucine patch superfamily enzyme
LPFSTRGFSLQLGPVKAADLFTLPDSLSLFRSFFDPEAAPWAWLSQIGAALGRPSYETNRSLPPGLLVEGPVYVHPTARLPHYGTLIGPIWIGPGSRLLPGCYLRGNVIIGANCTVGHGAEVKNALLMDDVQVPHRPYIGDSILGNRAHLGAGVVLSNLRLDQKNVPVRLPGQAGIDSGLRKFGALLGDGAEVGCNAVLNPGTILGRRALVTPSITVGGFVPEATIAHGRISLSFIPRRD